MYGKSVGGCSIKNRSFQSSQYQKSLKSTSTSITTLVESGKTNTCFISSSSTWVIDSGATDHLTGNPSLFITFQSHPSTSTVVLVHGSTSRVLRSGTIHRTPLITLTSILSLPQFSFNLIYVSKLTRTHNCSILFFPHYCLIQDLSTKRIIGRTRESEGLYILDIEVPKFAVCSGVVTPSNYIVAWVILFSPLKKLYPQSFNPSLSNCDSYQYAKLHRVHLSPRVNKRAFAPFEFVHSDVWGPCPVMSPTGFKYLVTFVNDFSRITWLYLIKSRFELYSHFSVFCSEIQTQFHVPVQTLRSDNAKEYLSEPF